MQLRLDDIPTTPDHRYNIQSVKILSESVYNQTRVADPSKDQLIEELTAQLHQKETVMRQAEESDPCYLQMINS